MSSSALIQSQLTNTNNEFGQALAKQKGSALDKDAFMLLLVTQFKYQDPLNPMEDKEFIAQLSQFSSLEQLMNLNESMTSLTDATNAQQMINATSFIGKEVAAYGTTISKKTTTDSKTGQETVNISTYRYAIGSTMGAGSINVYDANKQLVYSETLPARAAGTYKFEWNGKDNTGRTVPDGVYTIGLSCNDPNGNALQTDVLIDGKVEGVIMENGVTYLQLDDGRNVPLTQVRMVGNEGAVGGMLGETVASAGSDSDSTDNSGGDSTGSDSANSGGGDSTDGTGGTDSGDSGETGDSGTENEDTSGA